MSLLLCQLIAGYVWHRSARLGEPQMWVQIRFRPGSFKVSRDTHSERAHKVRGIVHMTTDADGEVQEVSPEFLEDYMADGAVMGRIVQEAGKDDGFETTYTCFETETTQALQELEHRPARKSVAPRLAGEGRLPSRRCHANYHWTAALTARRTRQRPSRTEPDWPS